ncbi:uncharacterized protein LOC108666484 [Hyalella azteca]|uniref:Uncharacterized protein LOC108666484 n=1 Tax=Hyalella azteca TaxID=294128 RepID=A0A8B7N6F3_HYAAZ|nr:uncharacterized protein LOC108666484 [Hyalella azteca]
MFLHMAKMEKRKKPAAKGVGGFRPVVDWRHITVRRRTVEDCKVITFIITSGVVIIVIGLIITVLGFFVVNTRCPSGWHYSDPDCLRTTDDNATFEQAGHYCADMGAALPIVLSMDCNQLLANLITGPTWLAAVKQASDTSYRWTGSGVAPNFTNWDVAPEKSPSTQPHCAESPDSGVNTSTSQDLGIANTSVDSRPASSKNKTTARNKTAPLIITPRKHPLGSSLSLPQAPVKPKAKDFLDPNGTPRSLPVPSTALDAYNSQEHLELILTPKDL